MMVDATLIINNDRINKINNQNIKSEIDKLIQSDDEDD